MSDATKVILSTGELAMVSDKNIFLTKQAVTTKTYSLFSSIIPEITSLFTTELILDTIALKSVPKIYKGENYNGFPYVMMDYPAVFTKDNIFAVRTMFWWGNFISITLHISGKYKIKYQENVLAKMAAVPNLFIAVGNEEWQHHFENDNYISCQTISAFQKKALQEKAFLKIALKYELHHWNMMQSILPSGYKNIISLLAD